MAQDEDDDVVVVGDGMPPGELVAGGRREVQGYGGHLVEGHVEQVTRDRLTGVRLQDGTSVACSAVVVATRMRARTGFLTGIGSSAVAHPSGIAEHLATDATGRTDVPGVWAAGNVADPSAQVGSSAAAGAFAAAQLDAAAAL